MQNEPTNAITLLKDGYCQVLECFSAYDSAASNAEKQELASKICRSLRHYLALEEQIFYPAFLQAVDDPVEYEAAFHDRETTRRLIDQIMQSSPIDEQFDSRVRILHDVIAQLVDEEECAGGVFAEAEESGMDLELVGRQMRARQAQFERGSEQEASVV